MATKNKRCVGILVSGKNKGDQCLWMGKGEEGAEIELDKQLCENHRKMRKDEKKNERFYYLQNGSVRKYKDILGPKRAR